MSSANVLCWEPTELHSPILTAARRLYEATIDADERIPWEWIERSAVDQATRRPPGWMKHLVLASAGPDRDDPAALLGYAYGAFIPGYGGYVCYVGVSPAARGRGVASRLFAELFAGFRADADLCGERLPFVVWESYRPTADEPAALHRLWAARERLFGRVGGFRADGIELITPAYDSEDPTATVPLQLFVKPVDDPADTFTESRLRAVTQGLLQKVYHEQPGDYYHDATLAAITVPSLGATGSRPNLLAV